MMNRSVCAQELSGPKFSEALRLIALSALISMVQFGCLAGIEGLSSSPVGLRITPSGDGPVVIYNFQAKPLPEIPLPNEL